MIRSYIFVKESEKFDLRLEPKPAGIGRRPPVSYSLIACLHAEAANGGYDMTDALYDVSVILKMAVYHP